MNLHHCLIILTQNCNLRCKFCFEGCSANKRAEKMSKKTLLKSLNWFSSETKNIRPVDIGWFGGEPLLEIDNIIEAMKIMDKFNKNMGMFQSTNKFNVTFFTNGILLNDQILNRLEPYKYMIKSIRVSCEGFTFEENKIRFNNKALFDLWKNNLQRAIDKHFPITIASVITKDNYNTNADSLIKFSKMGIKSFDGCFLVRTKKMVDSKFWENKDVIKSYYDNQKKFLNYLKSINRQNDYFFYTLYNSLESDTTCELCNRGITINYDGNLYPCARFATQEDNDKYIIGNIEDGFKRTNIWNDIDKFKLDEYKKVCNKNVDPISICLAFNQELNNNINMPVMTYNIYGLINRFVFANKYSEELKQYGI